MVTSRSFSRRLPRVAAAAAALTLGVAASAYAQAAVSQPTVVTSARVGQGIYEIVASDALDTIYVASTGVGHVKIFGLDPKTLAVKTTIDTSAAPAYGLGLNNKTQTLYTSNTRVGSASAIALKTGTVVNTIKTEADPRAHTYRVLVDEDANMTYISLAQAPGKVWVIDGKTNQLAATIDNVGERTTGLALDKAANKLYVSSLGTNEIVVVDLATRQVTARYPSGGERTTQLAFDPKTRRLFATNQGSGDISVLDMNTGAVIKTVKTGAGALGIGYHQKANQIYVANRQAGTVTVIDGSTYAVVADLKAGTLPNTVLVDNRTGFVYVTNKARGGRGRGTAAETPDEGGDTVTLIKP